MNRFRLLTAACVATIVYVLVSIVAGRDGLWAMNQLYEQKSKIVLNADSIKKINSDLTLEARALSEDDELIASYARKLGFVSPNEKIIKISGLPAKETQIVDPGTVMRHSPVKYLSEAVCKMLSLAIFGLVYFLLLLNDLRKKNTPVRRNRIKTEVVIQNAC